MKHVAVARFPLSGLAAAYALGTLNGSRVLFVPASQWTAGSEAAETWREDVVSLEAAGQSIFAATRETIERRERLSSIRYPLASALGRPSIRVAPLAEAVAAPPPARDSRQRSLEGRRSLDDGQR